MIDLIKFELYKVFSKKSVIIVLLLTILFSAFNAMGESLFLKSQGLSGTDDVYNVMKKYDGKLITEDDQVKVQKTIDKLTEKESSGKELTKVEKVLKNYLHEMLISEPTYILDNKYYTIEEIKDEMKKLKSENKEETYDYKNLNFIYDKVKNVEESRYYFKEGWSQTTDFNVKATLITTLIAVGLATIFSNEYQTNSAQVILSCKRGKSKLVLSKIITGLVFTSIVFIAINSIYLINTASYGFVGWDKPLESFKYYRTTPFDIRIIDFYIAGLCMSFIGAILFTLVTMFISLISKNNMVSLIISLGLYYIPIFLGSFIRMDSVARIFREINLAEAVRVESMFIFAETYNIFGHPVLYATVLLSLVVISIPIVLYLIRYFGKKQAI